MKNSLKLWLVGWLSFILGRITETIPHTKLKNHIVDSLVLVVEVYRLNNERAKSKKYPLTAHAPAKQSREKFFEVKDLVGSI